MSDIYCPFPDPSDYLNKGIEYPTPEGKDQKKSTDSTYNDINYNDSKIGKQESIQTNVEDNLAKTKAKKLQTRIQSEFYTKSSKSQTILKTSRDRSVKFGKMIYLTQVNTLRKAVNEI